MATVPVRITVNDRLHEFLPGRDLDPGMTLAYVLREKLGFTGLKISCDEGACGACTCATRTPAWRDDATTMRAGVIGGAATHLAARSNTATMRSRTSDGRIVDEACRHTSTSTIVSSDMPASSSARANNSRSRQRYR